MFPPVSGIHAVSLLLWKTIVTEIADMYDAEN